MLRQLKLPQVAGRNGTIIMINAEGGHALNACQPASSSSNTIAASSLSSLFSLVKIFKSSSNARV